MGGYIRVQLTVLGVPLTGKSTGLRGSQAAGPQVEQTHRQRERVHLFAAFERLLEMRLEEMGTAVNVVLLEQRDQLGNHRVLLNKSAVERLTFEGCTFEIRPQVNAWIGDFRS